ncbi:MAG TPA: NAD(+) diphosphatase [Myxococcota bacterium]|jgi:NAD+ diphosphatase|nr:NAD(+) diphosphatase [Myxococcota bacterium]
MSDERFEGAVFVPGLAPPERRDRPALWLAFRRRELLVAADGPPVVATLEELGLAPVATHFLGHVGEAPCFAAELPPDAHAPRGAGFSDLRGLFGRLGERLFALAGRAVQIVEWDRTHRFCGACGGTTAPSPTERSRRCAACDLVVFPRLAPAVIVAVERGDEILLARSPHFPPGFYSVPAGFVEPGETVEEAAAREIEEETGVLVEDVRYFASQPWPFPHSLMLGFRARWRSGDVRIDPTEIEDAAFFHCDDMPPWFRGRISIAGWLIEDFLRRHGRA